VEHHRLFLSVERHTRLPWRTRFFPLSYRSSVIRAVGFLACYLFVVDVLVLEFFWAILAAAVFTLASNSYQHGGHSQLLTVSFAPLLGWLMWRSLLAHRQHANGASTLWGCASAVLYGAWLLTCFYMAWFTSFFLMLFLLAAGLIQGLENGWRAWRAPLRWPLIPIGAVLAASITPFLLVYLPKAKETGAHSFADAMAYSPSVFDLLHVGSGNVLFGRFDLRMAEALWPGSPNFTELTVGFPPVLAIFAAAGAVVIWLGNGDWRPVWRAIALATAVSVVVLVHVHGHSLWHAVYLFVPGARALRVIARFAMFLSFPVTLLAVGFLASRARRWPAWIVATFAVLLVLEEISTFSPNGVDRGAEMRLLASEPPPPVGCRAFFIQAPFHRPITKSPAINALYPHNVDAMMLAEQWALPTLSGFATFNPGDWAFQSIDQPDYLVRVRRYMEAHDLRQGVCGLDLANHSWGVTPNLTIR
jgi:hypothetical protein